MVESLDHRTNLGLRFLSDGKLFYEVYMPTSRERERERVLPSMLPCRQLLWPIFGDYCLTFVLQ